MEDYLYKLLTSYQKLPLPLQNTIGYFYSKIPKRIRYGSFYNKYMRRISEYDNNQLNVDLLLKKVFLNLKDIPFYENKLQSGTITDLPIVNKKIISAEKNKFMNNNLKNDCLKANTGGTSGTPFSFCLQKNVSRPKEKAHFDWYWGQFGYKSSEKTLVIRGKPLSNDRLFEFQALDNQLKVSCYNLNLENFEIILNEIKKFKPKFIHAYPSALKIFTTLLREKKEVLNGIKAIFLGSEYLFDNDRKLFEHTFNARVVNWYGHSEVLVHAGNCLYSNEYHIFPFYGYLELVDDSGSVILEANKVGRIIATGLDNDVMPLIRYDTGDYAEYSEVTQCKCGFKGKSLKKIHGREQDYIVLNDLTKVSVTAFIFGQHFEEFSKIKEIQLIQNSIDELIVKLSTNNDFTLTDEKSIIEKMKLSINNKLNIKIIRVDYIEKTSMGKHKIIIQNIKEIE